MLDNDCWYFMCRSVSFVVTNVSYLSMSVMGPSSVGGLAILAITIPATMILVCSSFDDS